MNIEKFALISKLLDLTEIEKVENLAFFHHQISNLESFSIREICTWFEMLGLPSPNTSRLKKKILESKKLIKAKDKDSYKLHPKATLDFLKELPELKNTNENIETIDSIIPQALYADTRGYIESLSKQINASFENNIYDGCAVLMRRLLEILLIHSYEALKIEDQIKESNGDYHNLATIIKLAISNKSLALSRNTKDCLDTFRKLGNFSAHKIYYNAKRGDIKEIAPDFRATIEELLYKSKLLK
ncbi:DUF4145 domain-containing protein [Pseudomonas sp. UBA6323]|uniref:DUF4145 domain-containing protein n=1 Tax=Pseudomonas sp. UBA6323 TaxID=1947329 RepID=UPI0025D8947B|nr:DUF4145 domain-containing protein [Pseudomonas sp. UBA6323]